MAVRPNRTKGSVPFADDRTQQAITSCAGPCSPHVGSAGQSARHLNGLCRAFDAAEPLDHEAHVVGRIRLQRDRVARSWMNEAEGLGMQGLPIQSLEDVSEERFTARAGRTVPNRAPAVRLIAQDGMIDVARMDADLVRSACFEMKGDQRRVREGIYDIVLRNGVLSFAGRRDGHALAIARISADRDVYAPCPGMGHPPQHGQVAAFDRVIGKLACQRAMRDVVLRDHEEP